MNEEICVKRFESMEPLGSTKVKKNSDFSNARGVIVGLMKTAHFNYSDQIINWIYWSQKLKNESGCHNNWLKITNNVD